MALMDFLQSVDWKNFLPQSPNTGTNPMGTPPIYGGSSGRMPSPTFPTMGTSPEQIYDSQPNDRELGRLGELYQPEDEMSNRFRELLDTIPERNKPGVLRKIASAIVGLGGGNQEQALYAPYNRKMEDWKAKLEPTQAGMINERQENNILRQIAQAEMTNDRMVRRNEDIRTKEQSQIALNNKKLELLQFKNDHPELEFKIREDGMIIGLNPQTGQPIDTGVKSNELSDFDKIRLNIGGRLQVAQVQGDIRKDIESDQQLNRIELARIQADNAAEIARVRSEITSKDSWVPFQAMNPDGTPGPVIAINKAGDVKDLTSQVGTGRLARPGSNAPTSAESGTSLQAKRNITAAQLIADRPDLSKFIIFDKKGNVKVNLKPILGFNANEEQAKIIQERLGSSGVTTKVESTSPTKVEQRIPPVGKLKVKNPSGKEVMILLTDWPAAEKQGYKKVY